MKFRLPVWSESSLAATPSIGNNIDAAAEAAAFLCLEHPKITI